MSVRCWRFMGSRGLSREGGGRSVCALLAFYGVEGAFEVWRQGAAGVEWAKDFSPVLDVFVPECVLQIADGCAVFEAVYGVAVAQGHGGDGF